MTAAAKVTGTEIAEAGRAWLAEKTAACGPALPRGDIRRRRAAGEAVCSLRELKDRLHYCHLDSAPCDSAEAGHGRRSCPYYHP